MKAAMLTKLILLVVACMTPLQVLGTSTKVFQGLFSGNTVLESKMDESGNLFVLASPEGFQRYFNFFKVSSTGSILYVKKVNFESQFSNVNPSSVLPLDNQLVAVLANNGMPNGGGTSTVYVFDSKSGNKIREVTFSGPEYIVNGEKQTLSTGIKLVKSVAANKVYAIASSLIDISTSSWGYTVAKIDVQTGKVDWLDSYLKPNGDGGSAETALEVDGSYLLVGGGQGLFKYDVNTGERQDTVITSRVLNLVNAPNGIIVSDFNTVSLLSTSTLATKWTSEGFGAVQEGPGPGTNSMWFARTLAYDGNPTYWDIEVGVFSLATGSVQWRTTYAGGQDLIDQIVGVQTFGTKARVVEHGRVKRGWWIFARYYNTVRLLTFDHGRRGVSEELSDESIGVPGLFAFTDSFSWAISYDGNAIRFAYTPEAALTSQQDSPVATQAPVSEGVSPVLFAVGVGSVLGVLVAVSVFVVRRKRTTSEPTLPPTDLATAKSSSNPLFEEL